MWWLGLWALLAPALAVAESPPPLVEGQDDRPQAVHRFEYHNDLFIGRDDAFIAGGFGLQRHSGPLDGWAERGDGEPRLALARWVGENVPGLAASSGRVQRFGWGFTHTTQTPDDLRAGGLQLDDVAYAGTLGGHWSWTSFDNRRLNAFQVYAGVLGPMAGAAQIHDLLHRGLGRGPEPRGWRWQLENEPLLNLNYALKRKIAGPASWDYRGLQGDLAVGLHQALGSYHTATDAQIEFRAGRALAAGFARVPDLAGQGISMEPVLAGASGAAGRRRPRVHGSLVVRATWLWYSPLLDRSAFVDSAHRGVGYDPFFLTAIVGVHVDLGRFTVHAGYVGPGLETALSVDSRTSPAWINVTLDYRPRAGASGHGME